jgi:hypothetical protein
VVLEIIVEMGQINRITLCFDVNWFRDCLEVMEVVSIGHRLGSGEHLSDQLFFLQE